MLRLKRSMWLKIKEKAFWLSGWAYDFSKWATLVLIVGLITHYYIISVLIVRGKSMEPNYVDGNVLLINKWAYLFNQPKHGDVVGMYYPGETQRRFIKRIIGLPGDRVAIRNGFTYVNETLIEEPYLGDEVRTNPESDLVLGANEYFVMGDNRDNSSDSRAWGVVPEQFLVGRAIVR